MAWNSSNFKWTKRYPVWWRSWNLKSCKVGEIYDEYDDLPNYVIEIGHHTYHIKGSVPIRQFFDKYLSEDPPETRARNFTAWLEELAGGKKIRVDREFKYENYVMKVISVDKGKVMELELLELSKNQDDFEGE